MTISTSATLIVLFGIMAIINSNSNPFKDPFLFILVLVNHIIIEIGIKFTLYI